MQLSQLYNALTVSTQGYFFVSPAFTQSCVDQHVALIINMVNVLNWDNTIFHTHFDIFRINRVVAI